MEDYLEKLPEIVECIKDIKDTIITNIVLIGEKPAPTFREKERAKAFMERLSEFNVDECTTDSYQNPVGIIRGTSSEKSPIFVVAHLDTFEAKENYFDYAVRKDSIIGPGIDENSAGVGVLISLPLILKKLNIQLKSDIILAGVIQSVGKGNLRGIRQLLKTWPTPIRAGVVIEAVELGRLNHTSGGMIRAEIDCSTASVKSNRSQRERINAILVLNEIINNILELRLPQKPRSEIVVGRISGGIDHGKDALSANIGLEIRSESDAIVKEVNNEIRDIVEGIRNEFDVELSLKTISNLNASRLKYNHPLVKSASSIMKKLGVEPVSEASESELSIFLSHKIPAVTLGITKKDTDNPDDAIRIEPMFKGIAQIVGVLQAIDSGVCDG
jgi:tripeptide aminopeptidase